MQAILIQQLARYLTSVSFFQQVKDAVQIFEDSSITGAEKKLHVMRALRNDAVKFSTFLIGLAVELAVAYFKAQNSALK